MLSTGCCYATTFDFQMFVYTMQNANNSRQPQTSPGFADQIDSNVWRGRRWTSKHRSLLMPQQQSTIGHRPSMARTRVDASQIELIPPTCLTSPVTRSRLSKTDRQAETEQTVVTMRLLLLRNDQSLNSRPRIDPKDKTTQRHLSSGSYSTPDLDKKSAGE